jgi:WD40 repeat protein
VNSVDFSLDSERLVTASEDKTAIVWSVKTGVKLSLLREHTDEINTAVFSPDGLRVLTASFDGTAREWNAASERVVARFEGHSENVSSAGYSSDGRFVVTASWDGTARIWRSGGENGEGGEQPIRTFARVDGGLNEAHFSPDGRTIVTVSEHGAVRIRGLSANAADTAFMGHEGRVLRAHFSADGKRLVTASEDATARVWSLASADDLVSEAKLLDKPGAAAVVADLSADGRIAVGYRDGTMRLWRDAKASPVELVGHDRPLTGAFFSPSGSHLLTTSMDRTARLWDVGSRQSTVLPHEDRVTWAAFAPNGDRLVTASWDNVVKVWSMRGPPLPLHGHEAPVSHAEFSPDGQRIATASWDGTAHIWDARTGVMLRELPRENVPLTRVVFSPQRAARKSDRLVTTSASRRARLWNALNGDKIADLIGHRREIVWADFSPDGSLLVTASFDHTAQVWDGLTGDKIATLRGHTNGVSRAVFDPAGARIVTASDDGTARLWDAESGAEIGVVARHAAAVVALAVGADGRRILTAALDGSARLTTLAPVTRMNLAELRAWVCEEKLARSGANRFTVNEIAEGILHGRAIFVEPCARRGPLHPGYYVQWFARLWSGEPQIQGRVSRSN